MASLVAGGLLAPGTLLAADLDTNLVVNPGFENVDLNTVSYYNAPRILDWFGNVEGFAYSHDLSGMSVPDFANGGPLLSGAHWYFTPGNNGNTSYDQAMRQDIDVSSGATADAIAAGAAAFDLSAFFSTYAGQADRGFVRVEFLGTDNVNLGSGEISSPVAPHLPTWTQFTTTGSIPMGTLQVRVSAWGEVFEGSAGSPDGYTDNLDFRITGAMVEQPGDYNGNGIVDAADYTIWRDTLGSTTQLAADGDDSLVIDQPDYVIWKTNFGNGAGSGAFTANAVPEPAAFVLFALGGFALVIHLCGNCGARPSAGEQRQRFVSL